MWQQYQTAARGLHSLLAARAGLALEPLERSHVVRRDRTSFARLERQPGMTKLLLLAPVLLAACALDNAPTADDPSEGEADQALTGTTFQSYTCTGSYNGTCTYPLPSNDACVLAGIGGGFGIGAGYGLSGVWITQQGSNQVLEITSDVTLTATVLCVASATNVIRNVHWENWYPPTRIPGTTPSSRCFLSSVVSDVAFSSYNDSVSTYQSGGAWWVGGSATGDIEANATCFDATDLMDPAWGQLGGTTTGNLASNSGGGVGCALTSIGGVFETNSPGDGVVIRYSSTFAQWFWEFVGAKHASAECFK
jgi:hypothetical protein